MLTRVECQVVLVQLSLILALLPNLLLFFFIATAPPEIYTLSLHDALPIFAEIDPLAGLELVFVHHAANLVEGILQDRKSTRLNSSHVESSYAVFCLKKKNLVKVAAIPGSCATSPNTC